MEKDFSGVYCILNTTNEKRYVGSSVHVKQRFAEHKRDLKKGKHCNIVLQRAWKKYGEDSFCFVVLEENVPVANLLEREAYYITLYSSYSYENGYNIGIPEKIINRNIGDNFYMSFFNSKKRYSRQQIENVIVLLSTTNDTTTEISKKTGVNKRTIQTIYSRESYSFLSEGIEFIKRRCCHPKITEEQVKEVASLLQSGLSPSEIFSLLGGSVSFSCIREIRNKTSWGWLLEGYVFPPYLYDKGPRKAVVQKTLEGEVIAEFSSQREAARKVFGDDPKFYKGINSAVRKRKGNNTYLGFIWENLN